MVATKTCYASSGQDIWDILFKDLYLKDGKWRPGVNGSLKFLSKTLVLGSIHNPKSKLTQEASDTRANR
jgi:hypothetical protein